MPTTRKKTSSKPRNGKERDVCMCVYVAQTKRERDFATSGVARKFESNIALYTVVVGGGDFPPPSLAHPHNSEVVPRWLCAGCINSAEWFRSFINAAT